MDTDRRGSSLYDFLKWVIGIGLLAFAVVANSYYDEVPLLYRVLGIVLTFLVAGLVLSTTLSGSSLLGLIKASRTEIRKIVWPGRQDTTRTTMFVLVVVCISSVILWLLDTFLGWAVSKLIG